MQSAATEWRMPSGKHVILFLKMYWESMSELKHYSTMQCMMKEICALCTCRILIPKPEKEKFRFFMFKPGSVTYLCWFSVNLNERLKANSVLEKCWTIYFFFTLWMKMSSIIKISKRTGKTLKVSSLEGHWGKFI